MAKPGRGSSKEAERATSLPNHFAMSTTTFVSIHILQVLVDKQARIHKDFSLHTPIQNPLPDVGY